MAHFWHIIMIDLIKNNEQIKRRNTMKEILLGFVLVFTALFTNVLAEDNPRAVIIFDASGSMWGQINGVTKIEIARDALKNVVKEWNPSVELGLTVYGHRSKGDCNDIETVIPVGKIDKNRVIKTVMGIKPKGKTPISRSLRKVAEEIKYTEEKATIILISDGKETCDPDPCGTAKELEAQGIDFVTHVIGFNVDKKTSKQLECIANATGGEYFSAKNAATLNKAMKVIAKKVEVVIPPKPVVKKLKNNLEITASETEGGKWVEASYDIYKQDDEGKEGERMTNTSFTSRKKAVSNKLPVGKYILMSNYNTFEKNIPFEVKADKVTKLNIVFGQTSIVKVTASEREGGKWIEASYNIYKLDDEGKEGERMINTTSTSKKEAISHKVPVGKYILMSDYNTFEKNIPFEVKAGEITKLNIVFGQTNKVEITASETEGGKWVEAFHDIYKIEDGEVGDRITNCWSKKKKECVHQIPVGKYVLKSSYNKFKKETLFEIKAGEVTKLNIVFGQTNKVEITASESEGGKWVEAFHDIYKIEDGEVGDRITNCWSKKKKECVHQIPVGKYVLKSSYNKFKKETPFEIKAGEATKLNVIFGQTGKVEVSASEKEGGKWVSLYGYIYPTDEDGEKYGSNVGQVNNRNGKEPSIHKLPAGSYVMEVKYNNFKKVVPFEVKAGETAKVHVVMGETGKVEITASEKEGGKWVQLYGYIYPADENGQKDGSNVGQVNNRNAKDSSIHKLPVGNYVMEVEHDNFKKVAKFEVKAGEKNRVHLVFSQFSIEAKCINGGDTVSYEVYAASGQLVYDKKAPCSTILNIVLDEGKYRVEASVSGGTGEVPFEVGAGKPAKLILDLTNLNHEKEIKADTPKAEEAVVVPVTPKKAEVKKTQNSKSSQINIGGKKIEIEGISEKEAKQVEQLGAMLGALGGMLKGANADTKKEEEKQKTEDAEADKEFDEMSKDLDMFTK